MSKLFIGLQDSSWGRTNWCLAAKRLGVEVVGTLDGKAVLPLRNESAVTMAALDVNYMSTAALAITSDASVRGNYFPALPAFSNPDDVPTYDSYYIKPKLNHHKMEKHIAYTRHSTLPSAAAMMAGHDVFVISPDIGISTPTLEIDFAVNQQSVVKVIRTFTHSFADYNKPDNMVSGAIAPAVLMQSIQQFVTDQQIKGGIFNIQAVEFDGEWVVMDWNARPTGMHIITAAIPGVVEPALIHMLGLDIEPPDPIHIEIRSFWDTPFPNSKAPDIQAIGLIPSWLYNKSSIGRIYGIGETKQQVDDKFALLNTI